MNLLIVKITDKNTRIPKRVIEELFENPLKNGPSPLFVPNKSSVAISASHPSPRPMIAPVTTPGNVSLNLIGKKVAKNEQEKLVSNILDKFGLGSFKKSYPHELSGGMKQRVGLARAFVTKPDLVFLDEPFSELDFFTAKSLRDILTAMWKKYGTTIVMVSHYIDEAVLLSDRIAVFSERPSTIMKIFNNDLPRPRNHRSEEFYHIEDEVLETFESGRK